MNQVFDTYARYYDLLYRDKDYAAEAGYAASLIQKQSPNAKRILELGCGTGAHAEHLAHMGYTVHGVDLSEAMLFRAEARKSALPVDVAAMLSFAHGDVRSVRTGGTYDAVISLFHVMSYQTSNDDLLAAFTTARNHLKDDGVFIFDCWYGPAVLSDPPVVRVKRLEDEDIRVTRIAEPVMHPNENVVDVNYQVLIQEKEGDRCQELHEVHRMRYLFQPEVKLLLENAGFQMIVAGEWLTAVLPSSRSWGVYFVAKAV